MAGDLGAPLLPEHSAGAQRVIAFGLTRDGLSLFLTRALRLFSYGAIAPVFFIFCTELNMSEFEIGVLLTLILAGDLVVTLYLSTSADAFGRRKILVIGSLLKVLAGAVFASTRSFPVLVIAGIVGVISTSGGECGPFINVEQAALTDACLAAPPPASGRDAAAHGGAGRVAVLFGWYNALGYTAQALGSLSSGLAVRYLPFPPLVSHKIIFVAYGLIGTAMALLYSSLSPAVESPAAAALAAAAGGGSAGRWWLPRVSLGLRRPESKYVVARLSALFAVDAFGGAFVMQSFIAFWFSERWQFSADLIGYLLMTANVIAGVSGIVAAELVRRLGAMLTMIATHLPSNLLLMAVPLMTTRTSAAAMLVSRFCISNMDVPARQAYVAMVVASDERSAAGGITNIVRSLGASLAPLLLGYFSSAHPRSGWMFAAPWLIAGGVKCVYDVTLYGLYLCDTSMKNAEGDTAAAEAAAATAAAATAAAASPAAAVVERRPEPLNRQCSADDDVTPALLSGPSTAPEPLASVAVAGGAGGGAAREDKPLPPQTQPPRAAAEVQPPPGLAPPPWLDPAAMSAAAAAVASPSAAAEPSAAAGAAAAGDEEAEGRAAPLVTRKKPRKKKKGNAGGGGELAQPLLGGGDEEAPAGDD